MSEHLSGLILKDAFISYGRKESSEFATKLQKRFKKESMYAWFDATDIPAAVDWQKRIYKGIDEAHNFLFIISPHAVKSKYCFKEIKYAVKRNKRIIPILHVKPTDQELALTHPIINEINWIAFREDGVDFEKSFSVLLSAIFKENEYVWQHTDILLRAMNWAQNGFSNSLLLHGQTRTKAEEWLAMQFSSDEGVCNASDLHAEYICESTKNANNFLTDVFFHSVYSESISSYLYNALNKERITSWRLSSDLSGTSKIDAIRRGVQRASTVIYLISPEELNNELRQIELLRAIDFNKRIIPVLITDTPDSLIPAELKDMQILRLIDVSKQALDEEIKRLIRLLRKDEDYFRLHRNFLVQAIKWKEQDENQSILLQGARLEEAENWLHHAERTINPPTNLHKEYISASLKTGYEIASEVFICYSRVDMDFVRSLNDELQIMGRTTWLDTESIAPGRDFETEIKNGIESSDNVIFVISSDSVDSVNCQWELNYAKSFNKRFVNVMLSDLDDEQTLPPEIEKIQWIDFRRHHADFHKPLSELIRTIDNQRDHVREQTIWLKAAQKWNTFEKTPDRLLKGGDYLDAVDWMETTREKKQFQQATPLIKEYIQASTTAIENAKKRKQRSRRFLIGALTFVTIFSIISVILGLFAYYQKLELEVRADLILQQEADLRLKTTQLQKNIDALRKAEKELEISKVEIVKLQTRRDSAASKASTRSERLQIMQEYNTVILEKKDNAERKQVKVQQKTKQAQVRLEEFQKTKTTKPAAAEGINTIVAELPFFEGLAKDYQNGKWGFINKAGTLAIPHEYDQVSDFANKRALVSKGGKQVYIDNKGNKQSKWLDSIDPFNDGLAEVRRGKKKSFINARGEVIAKWFEDVYPFHEKRAKVKLNGKWGYINTQGKVVIRPMFDKAFRFRKGKARVVRNGVKFIIGLDGKVINQTNSWGGNLDD